MDERVQLIADWCKGEHTIAELAIHYGVSRKTIYKWVNRYDREGLEGLKERSCVPHRYAQAIDESIERRLIKEKLKYKWGPKKILKKLQKQDPSLPWPSLSTVERIFKKYGLVKKKRYRNKAPRQYEPFLTIDECNKVWSADFKGDFLLGNDDRCYPLTISDNWSRYLLRCRGLTSTNYEDTQKWFEWTFRTFGLPVAIRHDGGSPFVGLGVTGLSRLSVYWLKLGIISERIEPGKPQQNGRHERMHRTLKEATAMPPSCSMQAQQRSFDKFRREYNEERPHEALGLETPASVYEPSSREFPSKIKSPQYDEGAIVRQVRERGYIKFKGKYHYLTEVLRGEPVSLLEVAADMFEIRFGVFSIALLDMQQGTIVNPPKKR